MDNLQEKPKSADTGGLGETIRVIIEALLIALVIRTFAFQPFNIPSGSLIPTLLIGDYLFVSKYTYGYSKHSFPFSIGPFEGRIWGAEPKRGDIAVFKLPRDNARFADTSYWYWQNIAAASGNVVRYVLGEVEPGSTHGIHADFHVDVEDVLKSL